WAGWTTRRCTAPSPPAAAPTGPAAAASTGSRATPPATSSGCGRSPWTATPTPCWSRSTRSAPPATPGPAPASTPTCCCGTAITASPAPVSRVSRPGPRDVPQAGHRPPRHPGHPQAARRRRPTGGALPQPRRRTPRHPFVGVRSAATLTERDGRAHWQGTPPVGVPVEGDPLAALRATLQTLHTPRDLADDLGLPPFTGGMVGYLGYDVVRRLEKVGAGERDGTDPTSVPELTMLLTSDLAVMDHWEGAVWLIANAINHNDLETAGDEAYADAVARPDAMQADLTRAVAQPPALLPPSELPAYTARWGGEEFQAAVEDIKERI